MRVITLSASAVSALDASPGRALRGSRRTAELLNAMVALVGDVDVAGGIGGHREGSVELAVATAGGAPPGEVAAAAIEFLDALAGHVPDVDVTRGVSGHSDGESELPITGAECAPLREVATGAGELLDAAVVGVR